MKRATRSTPSSTASARTSDGPLLAFGLYDGFETPDLAALLPPPDGRLCRAPAAAHRARRL